MLVKTRDELRDRSTVWQCNDAKICHTSLPKMHRPAEMTRKPESPRFATIMLDSRIRPTHAVHEPVKLT